MRELIEYEIEDYCLKNLQVKLIIKIAGENTFPHCAT